MCLLQAAVDQSRDGEKPAQHSLSTCSQHEAVPVNLTYTQSSRGAPKPLGTLWHQLPVLCLHLVLGEGPAESCGTVIRSGFILWPKGHLQKPCVLNSEAQPQSSRSTARSSWASGGIFVHDSMKATGFALQETPSSDYLQCSASCFTMLKL